MEYYNIIEESKDEHMATEAKGHISYKTTKNTYQIHITSGLLSIIDL